MTEKILIGEVEKESVNNVFSDVLFLGKDQLFVNILAELTSYSNHFEALSLKKLEFSDHNDLGHLIEMCFKKGIIPIVFVNDFEKLLLYSNSYENCHFFSNRIPNDAGKFKSLGFQRHLSDLEKIQFNIDKGSSSLGKLNSDVNALEPDLREASLLYIDLNILSNAVIQLTDNKVIGIYPDNLIQLIKYASHSPHIKGLFFTLSNILEDQKKIASELMATIIWYFLEGLFQGQHKPDPNDEKYFVSINEMEEPLIFIHSIKHNKWWFQLDGVDTYYACTFTEYEQAVNGELPDRILEKIIKE